MGREIRRVPPNWEHPESTKYPLRMQPKYDEQYDKAATDWYRKAAKVPDGVLKREECYYHEYYGNPPDREYYLDYDPEELGESAWYQLYETVSEGTPVSPPFATQQELADYLAENGDFWDQQRRRDGVTTMNCKPWGKENAERFVFGGGYMPSMVISSGEIISGGDLAGEIK